MSEPKQPRNYTPYQQKIIKRFYDNQPAISHQRLAELVGELYLAEGKKKERPGPPPARPCKNCRFRRRASITSWQRRTPPFSAELLKELEAKK